MWKSLEEKSDGELKRLLRVYEEKNCGNCSKWMIKEHCPREKGHIVHMSEHACKIFERKHLTCQCIKEVELEIFARNI